MSPTCSNAQEAEKVRTLAGQAFPEDNCPISVSQARADLDLDAFDNPIDARVYISYINVSTQPVTAANFRIRFSDASEKNLGTFHGPDSGLVAPGQTRSQKWKRDSVNPRVTVMQVRVLQVRLGDGTVWESYKLQELNNPANQEDGSQGGAADAQTPQPAPAREPQPAAKPAPNPENTP